MRRHRKSGKKKEATSRKKTSRRRKAAPRVREDSSARMGDYIREPHPEFGV
jgi:hypothetical protein